LKPWKADNYDISVEYYMPKGGVLSAGAFRKNLSDFWGEVRTTATEEDIEALSLDPSLVGYNLITTGNVGSARISGVEFNWQQPLKFMSGWPRNFTVFANATHLKLEGNRQADFSRFIPDSASWGITYSKKPLVVMLKWNYRGNQKRGAQTGGQYGSTTGFYEYYRDRVNMDVNIEYTLTKRFALFANARNIFNVPQVLERYNDVTPDYARFYNKEQYGVQMALGVKGTF
jgi:outer membrane receptor for ferrienterochelin and colicin